MLRVNGDDEHVIVVAADAAFAMPMAVTLYSALRHLASAARVRAYVIDGGLAPEHRRRCERVAQAAHPGLTLHWIVPDLPGLQRFRTCERYSTAVYLRLLIPAFVPERHDRVLYLDSDVIVMRDLAPLWTLDLGEHPVWAVGNFTPTTIARALPDLFPQLEAREDARYLNSGVLLLNMPRWRAERVSERTIDFLNRHTDRLRFVDQDALNAVLAGRVGWLQPEWNIQLEFLATFGRETHDPLECRRRQAALLAAPGILHYVGERKPWHWRYSGGLDEVFFATLLASGWQGPLPGRALVFAKRAAHAAYRRLAAVKRRLKGPGPLPVRRRVRP